MRRRLSTNHRWHLLLEGGAVPKAQRLRLAGLGFASLLVGLGAAASAPLASPAVRLTVALGALALLALAAIRLVRRPARRESGTTIVADAVGLTRHAPDADRPKTIVTKPIVEWGAPFGITLLASYGRPHALLAFTTPTQTRYLPMRIDERTEEDDELFARICVLADLDLVDGVTHDAALTARDAAAIVRHAEARSGQALGRIFLSDGKGVPISLDRATLSVASRSFDLTSHLEWRALMFHESTGQAAALYQATWIKQNGAEIVLVAPMPASIVPREPNAHREASGRLGRALTRDLKLLQSPAEPPPSRDVRVAIDRPFMMAVRRVLDEAPLATRVSLPAPKPRATGRDSIV